MLKSFDFCDEAIKAILKEGYKTLAKLSGVTEKHITSMCETIKKTRPDLDFPSTACYMLVVAHSYGFYARRYGLVVTCRHLTRELSYDYLRQLYEDQKEQKNKKSDIDTPPKLSGSITFVRWRRLTENYLASVFNIFAIPLIYVIRDNNDLPIGHEFTSHREERIYTTPHNGEAFAVDNEEV